MKISAIHGEIPTTVGRPKLSIMPPVLRANGFELDFDDLYARMWAIAVDDLSDGTRLYRPEPQQALKWLIAELAGTPAEPGTTMQANNKIRQQVHAVLAGERWAERVNETSFRLLEPPRGADTFDRLHALMAVIPRGQWTSYKELSDLTGIHPKGLGSHIKNCDHCPNVVRVLRSEGQPHGEGFRWTDPGRRDDPNDVLRLEGVDLRNGRASVAQFVDSAQLANLLVASRSGWFDWPTVEWVKMPIDLETRQPNGSPIRMRHFLDCPHWYRDDHGELLGPPPGVATNEQMRDLPPCQDCRSKADAADNPERGPRLAAVAPGEEDDPTHPFADGTDRTAVTAVRREQRYLRRYLLGGLDEAPCALCGRTLPAEVLVAAHIAPRHILSEAERLDFASAAMLACALGCDALFELGHIAVDASGRIVQLRPTTNQALLATIDGLVGREVEIFDHSTAHRFSAHLARHAAG